jgi:prepilin-type N-terminal cleavage/methylation domain-containing protein
MERRVSSSDQGFSLIELVIVVAVIAILSITAVFSVGRTGTAAQSDAVRFSAAYARLRDAAILSRQSWAMSLSAQGWQVLRPGDTADEQWVNLGAAQKFRGEVRFQGQTIALLQAGDRPTADLIFLPDGQVTPFEVSFISAQSITRCSGSGWEGMACAGG